MIEITKQGIKKNVIKIIVPFGALAFEKSLFSMLMV